MGVRECRLCGGPTRSWRSYLCDPCRTLHRRGLKEDQWRIDWGFGDPYWTRERIIESIQEFAAKHGRLPTAKEWGTGKVGRGKMQPRRRRWPSEGSVRFIFGTWNEAIEAAGFDPRRPGQREGIRDPRSATCINGHPWVDTYTWKGKEMCRECRRIAAQKVAKRRKRERALKVVS